MNDVVVKNENAIANIEEELAKKAALMKENITFTGNSIKVTKAGKLEMPNGDAFDELELVIVDYRYRNQYFSKPFKQGEYSTPDCWAVGVENNLNLAPGKDVPSPVSSSCSECAFNQFKSAANGSGKACQNQFLMGVMLPDLGESEEVFLLKASPTAVKQVGGYVLNIIDSYQHPIKVVTKFSVDDSSGFNKLKAEFVSGNSDYIAHAEHMASAGRLLEASPAAATPKADVSATDSKENVRGSRAK